MTENLDPLWYWMKERHAIYQRRQKYPQNPEKWTDDPIFKQGRFCNVFRELDKVTIWIRKNWREPYANDPNLWFAMAVARQINHPDALRQIGYPEGDLNKWLDKAGKRLAWMRQEGMKIYGGAYIITAGGVSGPKDVYTIEHVLRPLARKELTEAWKWKYSYKGMWDLFMLELGFGPFISYEVATDLRHTRHYHKAWNDHMTWANAGPGAMRGMARIFRGDVSMSPIYKGQNGLGMMRSLLEQAPFYLPKSFPKLELRDIEHSLCETDKYIRVKTGEGRMKCKFVPELP